jgi:hypothetical protein
MLHVIDGPKTERNLILGKREAEIILNIISDPTLTNRFEGFKEKLASGVKDSPPSIKIGITKEVAQVVKANVDEFLSKQRIDRQRTSLDDEYSDIRRIPSVVDGFWKKITTNFYFPLQAYVNQTDKSVCHPALGFWSKTTREKYQKVIPLKKS